MGKRCQNFTLFNQTNIEADDRDDVVGNSKQVMLFGDSKLENSFWRFHKNSRLESPNQDDT